MKVFKLPVRLNTPVEIGPYTFLDETGAVIPLTSYVSVFCEVKVQGQLVATLNANFVNQAAGTVNVEAYAHTVAGTWMAQFYCLDPSNVPLWGEPIRYDAVSNVPDAALNTVLTR